jgi:hypothetical protein
MPILRQRLPDLLHDLILRIDQVSIQLERLDPLAMQPDRLLQQHKRPLVHLPILQLHDLQLRVRPLRQLGRERDPAPTGEETVGEVELGEVGPRGEGGSEGEGAGEGEGVVLKVESSEIRVGGESLGECLDTLHSDAVLRQPNDLEPTVSLKRLTQELRTPILQPVPPANKRPQLALLLPARLFGVVRGVEEGLGDDQTAGGTEAIVVEDKVVEGEVCEEKGDDGLGAAAAKGVVGEVEGLEGGGVGEGGAEGGEGRRDFRDETAGEDVGKVGDLEDSYEG